MPRARTQSGSANCAEIVSELATEIQAMPATSIAGAATQTVGASATTTVAATCSSEPQSTIASKLQRSRSQVSCAAAKTAPPPMQASSSVKVPALPPCSAIATSGSSASSALDCMKNSQTRSRTTFRRGFCRACCTPTRIAPTKRSAGSVLAWISRRQRHSATTAATDSSALSAKTHSVPAVAISAPAATGPITREAFIAMPLSASAGGSCTRGTTSGTSAANTGQRMASPTPLAKVSASSSAGVIAPASSTRQVRVATAATQTWVAIR